MKRAEIVAELGAEALRFSVRLDRQFATTEELAPAEDFAGQERAFAAMELGLGVIGSGFNVFVSGLAGGERLQALQRWVGRRVSASPAPGDWVYVHNFQRPDAPRAIYLHAGQGGRLQQLMQALVRSLKEELPKAFREEAFDKEKAQLSENYGRKAQELTAQFEKLARSKGFLVQGGTRGHLHFVPLVNGKPLQSSSDLSRLSETEQHEIEKRQEELMAEVMQLANKQREIVRQMEEDIRLIERRFCENLLTPLLTAIERELDNEKVRSYLSEVQDHVLEHLDDFKEGASVPSPVPFLPQLRERDPFLEYEVNVVVDNSRTQGAPVLVECSPTYLNLFGTIERVVDRFGRVFRSNRIEEEVRELIAKGTILIAIDGKKVGQVNGLSVIEIGGYVFGRPSRVTASVSMGQAGIINIERESRLSGSIHDKGVLILSGYLRNRYGQDNPLALSASLCFEQSYSGVEGDSASSAEIYALLSRLSNIPLRQDIAVTGSVNQWGEVQAIGGVNEKVEGFFDVCRVMGLTGDQGVMIPAANVRNLILRADLVEAVAKGKFHLYPVHSIDEGLEILTGARAGEAGEEGTVNEAVSSRLKGLAIGLKAFMGGSRGTEIQGIPGIGANNSSSKEEMP